jgi:hypothetical protein
MMLIFWSWNIREYYKKNLLGIAVLNNDSSLDDHNTFDSLLPNPQIEH